MSKLTEANEKLGTKHQLIGKVLEEAGEQQDWSKVKALGEDLDGQAKVDAFRALQSEMADLNAECKRLELEEAGEAYRKVSDELRHPKPAQGITHPEHGEKVGPSIGHRIVDSAEYKAFKAGETSGPFTVRLEDLEVKTLMSTTAGWAPESSRTGVIIPAVTRPIQVLDLIPMGTTDSAAVVYMEETLRTHSGVETVESGTPGEDAYELTERTSQVRKIATTIPVTDEQLEDVSQLETFLDQRLRFGLRQRLDNQVLNGNGTPPNLTGILNVAGIQTQARGTDPRFDAIHKAMTLVRVTGRAIPGGIVLNPTDWETIRLTRTADGLYIMGNPSVAGPMSLFGVPVALGDVIGQGTGMVGDFQNWSALAEKRGIVVEVGYIANQFRDGQKTLRADFRIAFVVYRPAAFCSVTGL